MSDTIFAKIIRKEIPSDIVYEDDVMLAFRDINPKAPEHILLIPKKPVATVNDIEESDAELVGQMVLRAAKIAKDLGFAGEGYRLVFNCNKHGGQDVYHIHLHLLGGRQMTWPPG